MPPGRGGPEISARKMSESELKQKLDELTQSIDVRSDKLSLLEALMLQHRLQASTLPSAMPTDVAYNSSSYGWRLILFPDRWRFMKAWILWQRLARLCMLLPAVS